MASHRQPLRDAPSAVLNSPIRVASTAILGSKRQRPTHHSQGENALFNDGQMGKRRFVETNEPGLRLHGLPPKRSTQTTITTLQRRLEAARGPPHPPQGKSKSVVDQGDGIKQWQKHYRRAFPGFVFYFDNVQDDIHRRCSAQVRSLGGREEAFFSRLITHVVTTRSIPAADVAASNVSSQRSPRKDQNRTTRTINPSLLSNQQRTSSKSAYDATLGRKMPPTNDIISKARDMGIKVWTMDKLYRVVEALSQDSGDSGVDVRAHQARERQARDAELSRLLEKDKRYATSDKSWMTDMVQFRGYYVYIRDMDERTKPVMIRDYPKTQNKENGKWPQLRPNPVGRCPYAEEPRRKLDAEQRAAVESTKAYALTLENNQSKERLEARIALAERSNPNTSEMPPPQKRSSTDQIPLFGSAQASLRRVPRFVQGEPVASGVQPSNITSAVRSQMISSAAALPGGKGGSSRELMALKRKVLERNGAGEQAFNTMRAAINDEGNRQPKRKHLDEIVEETTRPVARKKRVVEKEAKPGYCENCRDKYDDFEEHIVSKEHRKFAINDDHFRDLDALLAQLGRI